MFYTIYKTTNIKNGKYYIGKHKTQNLDDNYLGSGTMLKRASKIAQKNHPNGTFFGKKHTEEFKEHIGKINSIKQKGSNNSQYGTMWIYSLEEKISKRIKKDEIIPDGWYKGRKLKF